MVGSFRGSIKQHIFLIVLSVFWSISAKATINVYWDCYLEVSKVDCQLLHTSYFSSMSMIVPVSNEEGADVSIKIRSIPITTKAQDGDRYSVDFYGHGDLPKFVILDTIPNNYSNEGTLVRLIGNLQKGTAPFLAIVEPSRTDKDGIIAIKFTDPTLDPAAPAGPDLSGWYVSPSLWAQYSKTQMQLITLGGNVTVNYSDDSWRFQLQGHANYQQTTVPVNGDELVAEVFDYFGKTIVSYSFYKNWSVAVILDAAHFPGKNLDARVNSSVGLEWNLVPFLKTNDKSVAIRYIIGSEYQNYVSQNINRNDEEFFVKHSLLAYFTWHFETVDLTTSMGVLSPIDKYEFFELTSDLSLNWRIIDNLSIVPSLSVDYVPTRLNEPFEQDLSNPLSTFYGGGNFSDISYSGNLSVVFTFGNSLLKNQDQRWKGVSP